VDLRDEFVDGAGALLGGGEGAPGAVDVVFEGEQRGAGRDAGADEFGGAGQGLLFAGETAARGGGHGGGLLFGQLFESEFAVDGGVDQGIVEGLRHGGLGLLQLPRRDGPGGKELP
jgi:hypothetical protein